MSEEGKLNFEIYSPDIKLRPKEHRNMVFGRMWVEGVVFDGWIIVFGGQLRGAQEFTNTLARINLQTMGCEFLSTPTCETEVPIVAGHRVCRIDDRMYVFGGGKVHYSEFVGDTNECVIIVQFNDTTDHMNSIHVVNLKTVNWNLLNVSGVLPTPREGSSLTPIDDRTIYIGGGGTKIEKFEMFEFDTLLLTCKKCKIDEDQHTPSNRFYHCAVHVKEFNMIYVFGGFDFGSGGRDNMKKFYVFDLKSKKFKEPISIPFEIWNKGLSEFTTHLIGDYIVFVFGRQESSEYVQSACYNYKTNQWYCEDSGRLGNTLSIKHMDSRLETTTRAGHCSDVFEGNKIIVFGGAGSSWGSDRVSEVLVINTNLPWYRHDFSLSEIDTKERIDFLRSSEEEIMEGRVVEKFSVNLLNFSLEVPFWVL